VSHTPSDMCRMQTQAGSFRLTVEEGLQLRRGSERSPQSYQDLFIRTQDSRSHAGPRVHGPLNFCIELPNACVTRNTSKTPPLEKHKHAAEILRTVRLTVRRWHSHINKRDIVTTETNQYHAPSSQHIPKIVSVPRLLIGSRLNYVCHRKH